MTPMEVWAWLLRAIFIGMLFATYQVGGVVGASLWAGLILFFVVVWYFSLSMGSNEWYPPKKYLKILIGVPK